MTLASERERGSLLSIQVLRAIAAIGVTLWHIVLYEPNELPDAVYFARIGNAGVDLFFVISGFVMVNASESYFGRAKAPQEFFLRRLARIVPLYWATTTIILAHFLVHDLGTGKFSIQAVAASYLFIPYPRLDEYMLPVHRVGWTLNYEMFFYGCFCLALFFTRRTGVFLLALVLAAAVGLNWLVPLTNPLGYWANSIILEFVFGVLIALAFSSGFRIPPVMAGGVVLLGAAALAASDHWIDLPRVIMWGLPSALIVGAVVLANANAKPGRAWRTLSFLGDASYSLYLIHPIAIALPRRLFPQLENPVTWPWLYAAFLFAIALSAAVLVHLLFERPVTRVLQRWVASAFYGAKREPMAGGAIVEQRLLPKNSLNQDSEVDILRT